MSEKIKNLFNCTVSEFAMLALMCCLVSASVSLQYYGAWTATAFTATVAGSLIFTGWIVWAVYVTVNKKTPALMERKKRLAIDTLNTLLFIYWISVNFSPALAIPWLVYGVWMLYAVMAAFYRTRDRQSA